MSQNPFQKAQAIWPQSEDQSPNQWVGFRACFDAGQNPLKLFVTGSTHYRVFLNGKWIARGPARTGHGHFRVDEIELEASSSRIVLAIEVCYYGVDSFSYVNHAPFLQAEVRAGDEVVASTGQNFEICELNEKLRPVQRYSKQRGFLELYRMKENSQDWRSNEEIVLSKIEPRVCEGGVCIARGLDREASRLVMAKHTVTRGVVQDKAGDVPKIPAHETFNAYAEEEWVWNVTKELKGLELGEMHKQRLAFHELTSLKSKEWSLIDFEKNLCGNLGLSLRVDEPSRVVMMFDEVLPEKAELIFDRSAPYNIMGYELEPGVYDLESMDPYSCRYLQVLVLDGEVSLSNAWIREMTNPHAGRAQFHCSDEEINTLFEAARESFRQNAVDIYMDCPSRERAGWLCDSYFTARAETLFCGESAIERNFIENFVLPDDFEGMPEGMMPKCYPADTPGGQFIPNWPLWLILQLEEYLKRSGDRELVDRFEDKALKQIAYFDAFRNKDGLLENLEGWIFVDWSEANKFVEGVNYPSNMLYAEALSACARLYGKKELQELADQVRRTVFEQSFDGQFFRDQSLRKEGRLELQEHVSEACQYYAFLCGVATKENAPEFIQRMVDDFGPTRDIEVCHAHVHRTEVFIGMSLRLEMLDRLGQSERLVKDIKGYLLYMVEKTGTLWEMREARASCNHGFAAHVADILFRHLAGIKSADFVHKKIELQNEFSDLEFLQAKIPVGEDFITVSLGNSTDHKGRNVVVPESWSEIHM